MSQPLELPDPAIELGYALSELRYKLNIRQADMATMLGTTRFKVGRLRHQGLDPNSKQGELAILLLRIYRSLFALLGGDLDQMRHWLTTDNRHLQGVPLEHMQTVPGLVETLHYLDSLRGR